MKRHVLFVAALAAVTGALAPSARALDSGEALHQLFADEWERGLREYPGWASSQGDHRWDDRWEDPSPAGHARRAEATRAALARLDAIDPKALSEGDRLDHALFREGLVSSIESYECGEFLFAIDQRGGLQTLDDLATELRFETTRDFEAWGARLAAFPELVDRTIATLREGVARRFVLPRIVLERVPAQIKKQIVSDPQKSPFFVPFTKFPAAVPTADRERISSTAVLAIKKGVVPAFERLLAFFEKEYLPAAPIEAGLSRMPGGEKLYAHLARSHTTTRLTPKEIHEIGLKEVARIRAALEAVKTRTGFKGELPAFFEFLRTDKRFFYEKPEDLLAGYRALSKKVDPLLTKLFGKLPRMPYGVEPIPDQVAPDTTTAYYRPPAADGARAGTYFVNLYKPEARPRWEMVPLTLHESVPGHHLQIALAQEQESIAKFRRYGSYTAFVEGWGLYAESLGDELGLYEDPYDKVGQLTYEMWRAVRLVVDTGLHAFGWSRERAIAYFADNAPKAKLDIVNEIDRYLSMPGQALAYKIGELKLKELRARATTRLGARFSVRDFHDEVLKDGPLPLSILEAKLDRWLLRQDARRFR